MKKYKHGEKQQFKFILTALWYAVSNWRSILVVYGSLTALIATLGGYILNKVVIPSIRPAVRPIVKQYTIPNTRRLDTLESRTLKLEKDFKLFLHPD
jgi:hypothetical protein